MLIVDPHVHIVDLWTRLYPGFETPSVSFIGSTAPIARSYFLEELLGEGEGEFEIAKIVNVEARPNDRLSESRYLQSLADRTGYPQGIVCGVDLSLPTAAAELEAQVTFANVRGVRQILNVHTDPLFNYTSENLLNNVRWRENFSILRQFGLSFDMQLYPHQFDEAAKLVREHQETLFIINHAGMYADRTLAGFRQWRDGLRRLSEHENVCIKISGLGMLDHHWTLESIRPYAYSILDTFGVDRVMFASNFPVDKLYSSYSAVWRAFSQLCADFSETEKSALFSTNAERLYRI